MADAEHPLHSRWCFWYSQRAPGSGFSEGGYGEAMRQTSSFDTVESFWHFYNHLVRPSALPAITDYHVFRDGIKPMWEDPSNMAGGRILLRLRKGMAALYWEELLLALVGEELDLGDEICGVMLSVRVQDDRLSVWNRNADDKEAVQKLRDGLRRVLRLPSFVVMDYRPHNDALQPAKKKPTSAWAHSKFGTRGEDAGDDLAAEEGEGGMEEEEEEE